jgi:Zn-dependent alcohol dehydrogenase
MIRKGGRYLVIGQSSSGKTIPIEPALIVYKQLDILGFLSADISHFYRSVQLVTNVREKYPLGEIVSSRWRLDQTTEALKAMESGKEIKPVIEFAM